MLKARLEQIRSHPRLRSVTWRSLGMAVVFLAAFLTVIRPARTALNIQVVYPAVQRVLGEQGEEAQSFDLAHREQKTYFELRPRQMEAGLKPYYTFRIEGGFMFLLAGMLLLAFRGGLRAFGLLAASQVVLGLLSAGFLFASLAASPVWLSGSYFIMRYLSPAVCVMIAIGSVNRRFGL